MGCLSKAVQEAPFDVLEAGGASELLKTVEKTAAGRHFAELLISSRLLLRLVQWSVEEGERLEAGKASDEAKGRLSLPRAFLGRRAEPQGFVSEAEFARRLLALLQSLFSSQGFPQSRNSPRGIPDAGGTWGASAASAVSLSVSPGNRVRQTATEASFCRESLALLWLTLAESCAASPAAQEAFEEAQGPGLLASWLAAAETAGGLVESLKSLSAAEAFSAAAAASESVRRCVLSSEKASKAFVETRGPEALLDALVSAAPVYRQPVRELRI